jgi:glycoprotein endo-alpha-1,2-mannosidase
MKILSTTLTTATSIVFIWSCKWIVSVVVIIDQHVMISDADATTLRRQTSSEFDIILNNINDEERRLLLQSSSTSDGVINQLDITVGAFYYPWHGDDFHYDQGFLRSQLRPRQGPQLDEYDDTEEKTIEMHLEFSDMGKIDLWVTSWWGPYLDTDSTTQDTIMEYIENVGHSLKIALLYESTSRLQVDDVWTFDADSIGKDMQFISRYYFDRFDNYYRIDGKPVLIMYLTRALQKEGGRHEDGQTFLQQTVAIMRENANQDIFIVGDHAFETYPEDIMSETAALHNSSLKILDGITNCKSIFNVLLMVAASFASGLMHVLCRIDDIYGWMVGRRKDSYPGIGRLSQYYFQHQARWKQVAAEHGCAYIPSVTPGFNDRGARDTGKYPLSRRLTPTSPEGSFFAASLRRAMQLLDKNADNLLMVTSFNEWHEDTMIEPVKIVEETNIPESMTNGLEYVGYGTLYLDLLRNHTEAFEQDPEVYGFSNVSP